MEEVSNPTATDAHAWQQVVNQQLPRSDALPKTSDEKISELEHRVSLLAAEVAHLSIVLRETVRLLRTPFSAKQ